METKLADDPDATCTEQDGVHLLQFSCPIDWSRIRIPITWGDADAEMQRLGKPVWKATGEFPGTLTLKPSIQVFGKPGETQWHGYVTNGVAK